MKLRINGNEYSTGISSLTDLLKELDIMPERVAVEVNLRIIRRQDFAHYQLCDGDDIEIVYFVGGGDVIRRDNTKMRREDG